MKHISMFARRAAALLLACAQYLFLRLPRFPVVARGLEAHEKPMGRAVERVFGVEEPPDTSMAMRMAIARSHAGRTGVFRKSVGPKTAGLPTVGVSRMVSEACIQKTI